MWVAVYVTSAGSGTAPLVASMLLRISWIVFPASGDPTRSMSRTSWSSVEGIGSSVGEDGADPATRTEVGERVVHLTERATVRDEAIQIEPSAAPERDQARNVPQRVATSQRAAEQLLLRDREQRRRIDGDRVTERCRADAHDGAAIAGGPQRRR